MTQTVLTRETNLRQLTRRELSSVTTEIWNRCQYFARTHTWRFEFQETELQFRVVNEKDVCSPETVAEDWQAPYIPLPGSPEPQG